MPLPVAGVRRVRLHDLRHTSASLALEAGVPMRVVSDRIAAVLTVKPVTDVSEM